MRISRAKCREPPSAPGDPTPQQGRSAEMIKSRWRSWCLLCVPLLLTPLIYRMMADGEEAGISPGRIQTATAPKGAPPTRNDSVAVILAGDARTLLCEATSEAFNNAILDPLMDAGYSVHVFAMIKPTAYYGAKSWWTEKKPECAAHDTPFTNVTKSFVPAAAVEDAVAELSATSREVRVVDEASARASWASTLEQRAESIGCEDMLRQFGSNDNTSMLIGNGYAHYSQWRTVRDGYAMMEEAEARAGERFEYVTRLRPDTFPLMKSILDGERNLPLSTSDRAAVTKFGDGQAIMRRGGSSDAYFDANQIYGQFCDTHLRLNNGGGYVWDANTDGYFEEFVQGERGVQLVQRRGQNFTFWFRRPHSCTQLCKEKLGYL